MPAAIEIRAEPGADRALLDDGEGGRQGAGTQQNRKIVRGFNREAARDLPLPSRDRPIDARRRDHLVIEDDREEAPDIFSRCPAEALSAAHIETEIHDGLIGARIESGLRIDKVGPIHDDLLFDRERAARLLRRELLDVARRCPLVRDEAKFEMGRLAEEILQLLRILQSRHLDEDAVIPLALDVRLCRTERVDAPSDDLDRLIDRAPHLVRDAGIRDGQADEAAIALRHVERARAAETRIADRLAEIAERPDDAGALRRIGNAHLDAALGHRDPAGKADFLIV